VLGLITPQMNRDYDTFGLGGRYNQIEALDGAGYFTEPIEADVDDLERFAEVDDADAPVETRARAFLHANCSLCHRPGGPTPVPFDLRYNTPIEEMLACEAAPTRGNLGVDGATILTPGAALESIIYMRMNRVDAAKMPPIGRSQIDRQATRVVGDWIDGLEGCD
jgi:hypothetical protein